MLLNYSVKKLLVKITVKKDYMLKKILVLKSVKKYYYENCKNITGIKRLLVKNLKKY